MLTLEALLEEWDKDNTIDGINLDETSRQTPKLHSKYLKMLTSVKLKLKRTELDQKIVLKNKWLYYNGKLTKEEIEDFGWAFDPFKGLKVMKGDMDRYYDADLDIQKTVEKISYYKTMQETLQEIVSNITWRHQTIKNIIEWKKFQAGA